MHTILLDVRITKRKTINALVDEAGLDDYVSSRLTDVLAAALEHGHTSLMIQTLDDTCFLLDLTLRDSAITAPEAQEEDAPD